MRSTVDQLITGCLQRKHNKGLLAFFQWQPHQIRDPRKWIIGTTALPDEENDAGTGLDLVCRAPWKQSCPVEYYHLSEREMIVSRCGIPKTTKTETIPCRPCHMTSMVTKKKKKLVEHACTWDHYVYVPHPLPDPLSLLVLLLLLLLSLSLLSLPLFFLYLISCSLKHVRGVGFVFAGFDADHSTRSKTNDSDRNDVKTAGKGGKLQSCQQLLFECGYRWSFEFFSNENPWLWLLATIMVVATSFTCPSVRSLGCETQSRDEFHWLSHVMLVAK